MKKGNSAKPTMEKKSAPRTRKRPQPALNLPDETIKNPSEPSTSNDRNWFLQKYDYVVKVIKSLLLQGISPEKIALAFAMGITAGTFPLIGTHTFIGIALAFVFGLNQVAVYLGVWLSLPLYFLLLLPSLRVGEYLFQADPMEIDTFVEGLKMMFHSFQDFLDVWTHYGYSITHILVGWLPLATLTSLIVYLITLRIARLMITKKPQ